MIVGYSVIYVNEEISFNEALWKNEVMYTWDRSLEKAQNLIKELNEQNDDLLKVISLIRCNSEEICKEKNRTIVYKILKMGNEFGNIYIVPIYNYPNL